MVQENWQQIRKIFDEALRRKPEERRNYLIEVCGADKTLLSEVESLFASLDSAESFMEMPAVAKVADVIETNGKRLEKGDCLGHYEIIGQIGAGGMGEVYLAADKKLDRKVAVKVLNEQISKHESNLHRFIREAKSVSALNHPNILVVHEVGESDKAHYIVSEFIKGKTLRERLKESTLSLAEVLDIAIQTANALAAAHEANLVHRDIKPENIMIRPDGFVKVLDFGLAKLVEQKNKTFLGFENSTMQQNPTAKGVILGTINYMSPEQARGKDVDARTDIWSLGVVLYEMLTGKTPFASETTSDTISQILSKNPLPLSAYCPDIPKELERIVGKTLRKDREERYHHIKDLLIDLKDFKRELEFNEILGRSGSRALSEAPAVASGSTANPNAPQLTGNPPAKAGASDTALQIQTTSSAEYIIGEIKQHKRGVLAVFAILLVSAIGLGYWFSSNRPATTNIKQTKSIAVLPLKPITSNRDEIYENGIADSLIHRLGAMKGFVVRPLSATRKYADVGQDPIAAGREQQVNYVLASNYQLAGGKIRITAQLFNVESGEIEETYKTEKDAGNIFAIQDAIAGEVGNILLARFATTSSSSPIAKRGTTNEEAYRLYLQGRNLTARRFTADARKAVEYFEQAIRLDPDFAGAYSGMAHAYMALGLLGGGSPQEEFEKALEAVKKALELNNDLSEAHVVFGLLKARYEWDFAGAEKELLRAIELEPNSDSAHNGYANYLSTAGRFDEAIAEIKIALDIDPNSLVNQRDYGRFLYFARRYDEAIVQLKRVVEVDAGFLTTYSWLWQAYHLKGDYAQAYEWFLKHHQQRKANPERIELYRNVYETSGWRGVLQKQAEIHKSDEKGEGDHHPISRVALLSALLGDKDQAFEYLNKSFEKRHGQMTFLKVEPCFDSLRSDPRFDELVRRVGLK